MLDGAQAPKACLGCVSRNYQSNHGVDLAYFGETYELQYGSPNFKNVYAIVMKECSFFSLLVEGTAIV
jgi:hypothetical protein